jgi:hypothetical protein
MKKFLLIIFLCAGPVLLPAQPWRISGYKDTVAITIINEGKEAKVQRGSTATTFPLRTEGKLLRLKTSGENERLMRIVNVDIAKVDQEFKALDGSLTAGEKLINRANAFVGKKLMIVPEGYAGGVEDSAYREVNNNGEAGGVNEPQDQQASGNLWKDNWLYLLLAALTGAILSAVVTRAITGNKKKIEPVVVPEERPEPIVAAAEGKEPKGSAAELKKVKLELKDVKAQLDNLMSLNTELEKKVNINRTFDSNYFGEAFRKLVAPMNEALESGSRKDIIENMLKMSMHFSSLTRYKIAKKQAFDETNIHYLLNQKTAGNDVSITEIDGQTPVDKIPKNIKTVIDLLKENNSAGLDDTVLSGYRIKNL